MDVREHAFNEATLQRRRYMKYAGIGIGATAALIPVAYVLWRSPVRLSLPRRLNKTIEPPPRRTISVINYSKESSSAAGPLPAGQTLVADYVSEEGPLNFMPSMQDITQSTVFLAVKSFTLATLGVSIFAGTAVSLLVWKWDIQNMPDFNQKMHRFISSILPTLSSTIYRPFRPSQKEMEANGTEIEALKKTISDEAIDKWTWDEAKTRMDEAYQRGGVVAWTAAMVREMELENQHEIKKRASVPDSLRT